MFYSFLVTWIGMLLAMTLLKKYQRLTKMLTQILMTMKKTPEFHVLVLVLEALG